MKILLAEDDKNLGRLLQNLLKKENIKTPKDFEGKIYAG